MPHSSSDPLRQQFGDIDIYLFDQLLRGRIVPGMKVFDAGCGGGRNVLYLLNQGYDVYGIDPNARALEAIRQLPGAQADHFRLETAEAGTFPDEFADVAVSSAVLHFARDDEHFDAMLRGVWRTLKSGGLWFSRLASSIGIEKQVQPLNGRRCLLPDGSERYLVDEAMLLRLTEELGGELLDPLKTTVVQSQRAMTTWVVRKSG